MKKILNLIALSLIIMVGASCSRGVEAIDKAYQEACQAAPAEKIATTLCNGEINCRTLTVDDNAKLGAVLDYLANHGMYSANFEAQVDMYQFGKLLDSYREVQLNKNGSDRILLDNYIKNIQMGMPDGSSPN